MSKPKNISTNNTIPIRIGTIPQQAGIYWFLNRQGRVIYVGKAKNLKARLSSYRYITSRDSKTKQMLQQAEKIKFKTTDSELEALLIEAELIKLYQPRYNLRLTDDKSPLYIYITSSPIPHVKVGRKEHLNKFNIKKSNQFGPYPSGLKAKQVLKFIRKIFPFCSATETQIKQKKACFYSHLSLCPGICTGQISKTDYLKNIANLKAFLKGKKKHILRSLKQELKVASTKNQFELALLLRDKIQLIENLTNSPKKPELNLPTLEQDESGNKLKHLTRILRLHTSLPKNYQLNRIEAYDVSNLEGLKPTASMVVFTNAKPQTSEYRMFSIKTLKTPNDPGMLKEALNRRAKHHDWPTPNLILIDGGITQLKAALSAVTWNIPVVSIAKNPDRLILPPTGFNSAGQFIKLTLEPSWPATKLLQHLRDESHRFAKNYHLKLRSNLQT